jgi:CopG family transcriptional regulator / antitoxin EndoAI
MSTVNISFNKDLLKDIDKVAQEEARSRSELIREAARNYIQRKRSLSQLFQIGKKTAQTRGLTEQDIEDEIKAYRNEKNRKTK